MNFAKIIDAVPVVVATVAVLSIPFFVYKFLHEDQHCQQAGGVLVKSAGGWICIKTETK
jgi:hypothetical protein